VRSTEQATTTWANLAAMAIAAIVLADLSGMSKAEVERIWLPFVVWLAVPCALLPRRWVERWLASSTAARAGGQPPAADGAASGRSSAFSVILRIDGEKSVVRAVFAA
jgi:hypothetical protein